jgi:plastocyanin
LVGSELRYAVYARDAHGTCDDPECGNLMAGLPISWRIESGGGTIAPAQDTTAFGRASEYEYDIPLSVAVLSATEDGNSTVAASAPSGADSLRVTFTSAIATQIVGIDWDGFHSDTVAVSAGKTVGWRWLDGYDNHDVTFEDAPSQPTSSPHQGYRSTFTRTFTGEPRTVRYRCTAHSTSFTTGEVGVVIVQ